MGGSSQQPVTQQTTQSKDPWAPAQPYLSGAMQTANAYLQGNYGYQPYTGPTTAPLNNNITQGMLAGQNIAANNLSGSPNVLAGQSYLGDLIKNQGMTDNLNTVAGQFGDIYSQNIGQQNPYLQGVLNQQMDKVNSAMSGAGRYGSGQHSAGIAQAIAPTLAQDYMQRQQLGMQATGALGELYGQGLTRAGQAAQLAPALDEAQYAGADRLIGYGNIQRSYDQAVMDANLKLWNAQQAYPWEQLARAQAIFGQAGGLGGTQITSTPGATPPSGTQRALGGALAGAGLGSAIFPGIGTGIGALGGGLLGMMG